jgi:MoxR-like ATPase
MEERVVSVGKRRHQLPKPFFVVATMNPFDVEEEMFRLPHGQRDRFAICTGLGYPTEHGEEALLGRFGAYDALADIDPIVAPGDVVKVQRSVSLVAVPDEVRAYMVRLVRATRERPEIGIGASPRAALSLQRCCQALALIEAAVEVSPDHVRELFVPCLMHRMQFRRDVEPHAVCDAILAEVPGPAWNRPTLRAIDLLDDDGPAPTPIRDDLPGVSSLQRRFER